MSEALLARRAAEYRGAMDAVRKSPIPGLSTEVTTLRSVPILVLRNPYDLAPTTPMHSDQLPSSLDSVLSRVLGEHRGVGAAIPDQTLVFSWRVYPVLHRSGYYGVALPSRIYAAEGHFANLSTDAHYFTEGDPVGRVNEVLDRENTSFQDSLENILTGRDIRVIGAEIVFGMDPRGFALEEIQSKVDQEGLLHINGADVSGLRVAVQMDPDLMVDALRASKQAALARQREHEQQQVGSEEEITREIRAAQDIQELFAW